MNPILVTILQGIGFVAIFGILAFTIAYVMDYPFRGDE